MNIVIAGSGEVGFHLAQLLVNDGQSVTLIDSDDEILSHAADQLDVRIIRGDVTSTRILENAGLALAKLFIAVTTSQSTNLLACILAKKMGVQKTVARISNPEFLDNDQKTYFKGIGVDHLLSPRWLAAKEVLRLIKRVSATDIFEFEEGKISIIGFTADQNSPIAHKTFEEFYNQYSDQHFRVFAVLRGHQTFIPQKTDRIMPSDHIYLSTDLKDFQEVNSFVGKTLKKVRNIMIIGDTAVAKDTAKILDDNFDVKVVIKSERVCKIFIRDLKDAAIIKGDPSKTDVLVEEGLEHMDAFIAMTDNSETNILTSLMAEELGVYKTIALVDNPAYTHLSQKIGIDTIIDKKLLAANNIFRYVRKGKIEAIASFHGVDAEIIEYIVHEDNKLVRKALGEINFPEGAIIAGVIRGSKGVIPDASLQLQIDDKVIVFMLPVAIKKVESLFK
jgi:trk system potassium uptake protein TrkA